MASAQGCPAPQLQALIAESPRGMSGRLGTLRAGPSDRTTCGTDALSKK
ncbi:hypothetical protein [Streptomyces sp. NPDC102476]